ncbi:MAG: DUF2971 domain-containing protein [Lentimicrobiaceae bacterium]|jgi:hypothetical protein
MKETIYKYVDLSGLELILRNQTLKFSHPMDFNDPFEFHHNLVDTKISAEHKLEILEKRDKNITPEKLKRFKAIIAQDENDPPDNHDAQFEERKKSTKITCFSEIDDNILMWAHYADKHRGACIGFNTRLISSCLGRDSLISNVVYYSEFITKNLSEFREDAIFHWICSKGLDWEYEKEVRIVLGPDYPEIMPINIVSIGEIILGCSLPEEEKQRIESLIFDQLDYRWIILNEMKISSNKYALEKNNRR